jgi:hypothetical protein
LRTTWAPFPEDIALTQVVVNGMAETQTDPAAWSHVTQVLAFGSAGGTVTIQVATTSDAVVERVCEQARRYMYSPNPSARTCDDKNDACLPIREESP